MMHDMRRKKPKPTLLPTQGIFNLPHQIGMAQEELAFDDGVSSKKMDCSTAKCYGSDRIHTTVTRVTNPVP